MPKKNPIKKRKQGSMKPNPMPVGDPKKYMGDGEWEQYDEPQGAKKEMVNPEGLPGVKIGESVEMVMSPIYGTQAPVHINPTPRLAQAILGSSQFEDLSGVVDSQNLYLWASEEVKHNDVVDQLGLSPKAVVPFVYIHARASDPHKSVVVSSWNMAHRDIDLVNRVFKTNPNYRKVFGTAPVDAGEVQDKMDKNVGQKKGPAFGISEKVNEELGPLGGFMAPMRGGDGKMAIPDTTAVIDPASFEFSALGKSKKDAKRVRKQVNKNIKRQKANPNFEKELTESNVDYLKSLGDQMQEVLREVLRQIEWSADDRKSSSLRAVKVREWLKSEKGKQRVINDWVKAGAILPAFGGIEGYREKSQGEEFMAWLAKYLHDPMEEWEKQQKIRDQGPEAWEAYVNQYMAEMIRLPIFSLISGDYEVKKDEKVVGYARVKDGVVEELTCASGAEEDYRGEVLTHLLNTIIDEADMQNSNLSLQLQNKDDDDMKRFLERFGFKHIGHGVMQRSAGSIRPPSVEYLSGQEGP